MLKLVSQSEELRQIKIPFPLCALVAARVGHCIAWVPMKKPLRVRAVKALSAQWGWSFPSVFIILAILIDSLFAWSCLRSGLHQHCFCWQELVLTTGTYYRARAHTHTHTYVYMYSESAHFLSAFGDQDSLMDLWIPHNTICWLINNSILSVCKHVWIQSHLPFPRPSLNIVCCVLELGLACVYMVLLCVD